jgi:aspartyl/asparaginyl beta-hydroxylase (cupin superfamily)
MNADRLLTDLREHFGSSGMRRVEECLQVLAGKRRADVLDDDQEATRIFFPGLAAKAWHSPADFEWAEEVEACWMQVRDEYHRLQADRVTFYPYEDQYTGDLGWKGWSTWHLYRNGVFSDVARDHCPAAVASLMRTPHGVREGLFSVLAPGAHLLPHTGGVNLFLTVHLALIVPENCALRVGSETRTWQEGKLFIFDDSFIHEAWNRSDRERVVMLWDIWHPDLTELEISSLTWLAPRMQDYLRAH